MELSIGSMRLLPAQRVFCLSVSLSRDTWAARAPLVMSIESVRQREPTQAAQATARSRGQALDGRSPTLTHAPYDRIPRSPLDLAHSHTRTHRDTHTHTYTHHQHAGRCALTSILPSPQCTCLLPASSS